jgi:hypothetical protein
MKSVPVAKVLLGLIIFPFMAYEGIDRGATYGSIDESQTQLMLVTSVVNANGRAILPEYQARGTLSSGAVTTVNIFKREFEKLKPGDKIAVVSLPTKTKAYITASRLEESKPFVRLGSFTVTWHFPVAIAGWIILVIYIFHIRLNARRDKAT